MPYLGKKSKGGKRIGSGRKKADYETKTIAFRSAIVTGKQIGRAHV